jgi:hypothetical protein
LSGGGNSGAELPEQWEEMYTVVLDVGVRDFLVVVFRDA